LILKGIFHACQGLNSYDLESKGDTLTVGSNYTVGYANGKGVAKPMGASSAQVPQRTASKGTGHGI